MSKSLGFIKDSLVGHKLKIDRDEYERLYEIGKEAQIFFPYEIKRIWENEGLDCLKTDLDSGRNKRKSAEIHYFHRRSQLHRRRGQLWRTESNP